MKRIFVIYTGGTICTTIKDGKISTDPAAASALTEIYESLYGKNDLEFLKGEFFGILSENMTVEKWNLLADYLKEVLESASCLDGIIIAHGTDTLAYSAALFSQLLKGISIPVFFVSSAQSIVTADGSYNPQANGVENFAAAVECIKNRIKPDVFATYKNSDGIMYLHKGALLKQCENYSDDFYSRDMLPLNQAEILYETQVEKSEIKELPLHTLKKPISDCVLKIEPYVGLNYSHISLSGVKAVLHGTYHSGTACTGENEQPPFSNNSILYLLDRCLAEKIDFYFAPAKTGQEKNVYASVPFIERFEKEGRKANFCYGETSEFLYTGLLLEYSQK